jgi:hypothetical protein
MHPGIDTIRCNSEDWLSTGGVHHSDVADLLNWTRRPQQVSDNNAASLDLTRR